MARKSKTNFNLDKLRICFKQPNGLFERLNTSKTDLIKVGDNISLFIIRENEDEETPSKLMANVILHNEGDFLFGHFVFNNSKKYEGLCWLTLSNQAFYRKYKDVGAYSFVYYLNALAYNLELLFNNITEIEICADTTNNIEKNLRRLIKDHENYDMIYNGKKLTDPFRKIENYHEAFSRSRAKLIPSPTLYFEQVKKDAPLMRVYNKSVEISDNKDQKNYIEEWNNFGNKPIHRAEVRLKNESIKQAWEKFTEHLPDDEPMKQADGVTQMLDDQEFLRWIWREYTNRLVTFNDPNGEKTTLHDLITA